MSRFKASKHLLTKWEWKVWRLQAREITEWFDPSLLFIEDYFRFLNYPLIHRVYPLSRGKNGPRTHTPQEVVSHWRTLRDDTTYSLWLPPELCHRVLRPKPDEIISVNHKLVLRLNHQNPCSQSTTKASCRSSTIPVTWSTLPCRCTCWCPRYQPPWLVTWSRPSTRSSPFPVYQQTCMTFTFVVDHRF